AAVEHRLEPGVRQRFGAPHRRLHRAPAQGVVGARTVELDAHDLPARQLGDVDPAALAPRHVVRPGPGAGNRFLQRGGIAGGQVAVAAGRSGRGIGRGAGVGLLGLALARRGDLLQLALGLLFLTAQALTLGPQLFQLFLALLAREAPLLLGLFLRLAFLEFYLLLAAALLLLALGGKLGLR